MEMGALDASATTLVLRTSKHRGATRDPKENNRLVKEVFVFSGFHFEVVCKTL